MAEMKTEQKNVLDYLSKNYFLVPIYQRAYMWGRDECEQLWNDVYSFFEEHSEDKTESYFLGAVVTYQEDSFQNIIDGQQRTTTLNLLIRALYEKARVQTGIDKLKLDLASCLWGTDDLTGDVDFTKKRLKSEVATDSDDSSFTYLFSNKVDLDIVAQKPQSLYEQNYLYFTDKINELAQSRPTEWFNFCLCLLRQCIVLPIECNGQENALRIFNTLNNRGLSLSDADIFKGLMFEYKKANDRQVFAEQWKELESKIQQSDYLERESITFLFMQYEHIIRALHNEVDTVVPSPLDFWTKKDKVNTKNKKANFAANQDLLTHEETFETIKNLGEFWCNPYEYFSDKGKKYFDILGIFQNKIWRMTVSMAFYHHNVQKNPNNKPNIFDDILPQIVAYCTVGLIYGKSGGAGLIWGFMNANIKIKNGETTKLFEKSLNLPSLQMPNLPYFVDFSTKVIAKHIRFVLTVYALRYDENQPWEWNKDGKNYSVITSEIEHILPKKWQEAHYNGWNIDEATSFLEQIGNKMLLEKRVNIHAGNNSFVRKKEIYQNSYFKEAQKIATWEQTDFLKSDIEQRNQEIHAVLGEFFKEMF